MHFLMYSDPRDPSKVDPDYSAEYRSAVRLGAVHLCDGAHVRMPVQHASEPVDLVYHGWMMTPRQYADIYHLVASRGYKLINNPKQYLSCHYFDNWYPIIKDLTPTSTIIEKTDALRPMLDLVLAFRKKLGTSLVIKDSVKSLKHQWNEACFIDRDAGPVQVAKVLATFFESKKQTNDFQGSLVVREYVPLKYIGPHKISGMPVSHELRGFVLKGKLLYACPYWDETAYKYKPTKFPMALFERIATRIYNETGSNLFTVDLGMLDDETWTCLEVGDGQVSALPDSADFDLFFKELVRAWRVP